MKIKRLGTNMTEVHVVDMEGTYPRSVRILFSYNTPVACVNKRTGKAHKTAKKHSRTTTGHINKWLVGELGMTVQEVLDTPVLAQERFDSMVSHV